MNQGAIATNGMYSIWNWTHGLYDYYQSPESTRPKYGQEVPPPPRNFSGGLGEDPDYSGHSLPRNTKFVGRGALAMGEVVSSVEPSISRNPWIKVALAIGIPTAILWLTTKIGNDRPQDSYSSEMEML